MRSDLISLYQRHVANLKRTANGVEWVGDCPFAPCRGKNKRRFYVNGGNGLYHCKGCDAQGNAITFAKHFGEDDSPYWDIQPNSASVRTVPDIDRLPAFQAALQERRDMWPAPWRPEIVDQLQIGWDNGLVFPIFNKEGEIIGLNWHKIRQTIGATASLYPAHLLKEFGPSYIIHTEGQKDCVSFLSQGLQAVTSTGGALSLPKDMTELRHFKRHYVCLDNDVAGDQGTEKLASTLLGLSTSTKVLICDLSRFVEERGDVTDYLSLEGKNRESFSIEVVEWARLAKPFSDVPDFARQRTLSDEFLLLDPRDRLIYLELLGRVSRHRVQTAEINGLRVRLQPGQYVTSIPRIQQRYAGSYSDKMIRTSLERLRDAGFIIWRDLKERRGRVITVVDWNTSKGQTEGQTASRSEGRLRLEFPPSILPPDAYLKGQTERKKSGSGRGPDKALNTLGERNLLAETKEGKNGTRGRQLPIFSNRKISRARIHGDKSGTAA